LFFLALFTSASVFTLVILAWSELASTTESNVIVPALGKKPSEVAAIAMMVTGFAAVILWRFYGLNARVYEGIPGIIASLSIFFGWSFF